MEQQEKTGLSDLKSGESIEDSGRGVQTNILLRERNIIMAQKIFLSDHTNEQC